MRSLVLAIRRWCLCTGGRRIGRALLRRSSTFSRSHRCVAVDLRGHGESDAPEQEYTIEGFADDVAAVCDELGVKDAALVGHSMGGAVVLALAVRRPDLTRAVAMLDPAILFPAESQALLAQLAPVFAGPEGLATLRAILRGPVLHADERRGVEGAAGGGGAEDAAARDRVCVCESGEVR